MALKIGLHQNVMMVCFAFNTHHHDLRCRTRTHACTHAHICTRCQENARNTPAHQQEDGSGIGPGTRCGSGHPHASRRARSA